MLKHYLRALLCFEKIKKRRPKADRRFCRRALLDMKRMTIRPLRRRKSRRHPPELRLLPQPSARQALRPARQGRRARLECGLRLCSATMSSMDTWAAPVVSSASMASRPRRPRPAQPRLRPRPARLQQQRPRPSQQLSRRPRRQPLQPLRRPSRLRQRQSAAASAAAAACPVAPPAHRRAPSARQVRVGGTGAKRVARALRPHTQA